MIKSKSEKSFTLNLTLKIEVSILPTILNSELSGYYDSEYTATSQFAELEAIHAGLEIAKNKWV